MESPPNFTQTDFEKTIDRLAEKVWEENDEEARAQLIAELKSFKRENPAILAELGSKLPNDVEIGENFTTANPEVVGKFIEMQLTEENLDERLIHEILEKIQKVPEQAIKLLWKRCLTSHLPEIQGLLAEKHPQFLLDKVRNVFEESEEVQDFTSSMSYGDLLVLSKKDAPTFHKVLSFLAFKTRNEGFQGAARVLANQLAQDVRSFKTVSEYCEMFPSHLRHYAVLLTAPVGHVKKTGEKLVLKLKASNERDFTVLALGFPEIKGLIAS